MNKILVTTDLSNNSKSAIRFAIQLASQNKAELTFFHVYHIMRPTGWNEKVFLPYEETESAKTMQQLRDFITEVYTSLNMEVGHLDCVTQSSPSASDAIMNYATGNNFQYICISRKGDGQNAGLFGTHTSNLVNKSDVPVLAIPANYQMSPITHVVYASDLDHVEKEIETVASFTDTLDATVELLHLNSPATDLIPATKWEAINRQLDKHQFSLRLEKLNFEKTLLENIDQEIERNKPSILVMFSHQRKSFFEKLFLSSYSVEFSATAKIPLLIFKKN